MSKVLTSADAPAALRLLLHDAATYDAAARTGGVNGSIVLSEELSRPENKDLKGLVDKLAGVRKALEASKPAGQKNISWADTIVLAAKVTQDMAWREEKLKKNPKNGEYLVENFSTPITIRLGRRDASEPDAAGRFPAPGSSPSEVRAFMSLLGEKDPSALEGPFGRKAAFWDRPTFVLWTAAQPDPAAAEAAFAADPGFAQWKDKYDKSRKTNFRTDYEVDFVAFFNKLADLGAKFDKEAYLYDLVMKVPDRL